MRAFARTQGFDLCRVTSAEASPHARENLGQWLDLGWHGEMNWMAETFERRADPKVLWPQARSAILLGLNYGPDEDPRAALGLKSVGAISVYARHRDYHDIVKGMLKRVAARLVKQASPEPIAVKVFVDTAPVMEKPLAQKAGLGWQGKHTNLVSREFGSWLFLGSIFTDLELPADEPETDRCGSCRACLDACPTRAFPAPYRIDARRCISYLTIEEKGAIPIEFRPLVGNRIYGCDDCLAACPWNKFARAGREAKLAARADLNAPPLAELLRLDEPAFRERFAGGPVKRIGHSRFLRNVLIASGNSGTRALIPLVMARLAHGAPIVRGAAVWALGRLCAAPEFTAIADAFSAAESNPEVSAEWRASRRDVPRRLRLPTRRRAASVCGYGAIVEAVSG